MNEKISIKEFENWVYTSKWLKKELTEDEYTDLISINFNNASSIHDAEKILGGKIDNGKFESVKMLEILSSIIQRDGKEAESLIRTYDLYCKGYFFLKDLGLGIGLSIKSPHNYSVEYFYELNENQKKELTDSVYPFAKELAVELKDWLMKGDLKLIGEKESELNRWQYIDNRNEEDKISRIWKVDKIDNRTGHILSETNLLLTKNRYLKAIFKRKKPNC